MNRTLRPDAQPFDEIRIITVPRWKESELSGDEWRISATIQFLRKGTVRHETHYRDVQTAAGFVWSDLMRACDDGNAYFAGEGDLCDQEGCSHKATYERYFLNKRFCREGHESEAHGEYRMFCSLHSKRGDCGLDDADRNYRREAF